MKMVLIWIAAIIVLAFAGYGAIQVFRQSNFAVLKDQCHSKIVNLPITIKTYFSTKSDFSKIQQISLDANSVHGVASMSAVSAAEALAVFKQQHSTDKAMLDAINTLGANPLEPYLAASVMAGENASDTIAFIKQEALQYGVSVDQIDQSGLEGKQSTLNVLTNISDDSFGQAYVKQCLSSSTLF